MKTEPPPGALLPGVAFCAVTLYHGRMQRTALFSVAFCVLGLACGAPVPVESRALDMSTLGIMAPVTTDQVFCCSNPDGCAEPSADGSCPEGKVAVCCADEETCNADACWYECGAKYCDGNN